MPGTYEGAVSETKAPISATIPTRTGYTFTSWCLGAVTAGTSGNNYADTCSGITYIASNSTSGTQYIGIDRIKTSSITLRAMWQKNKYTQTVQVRYQDTNGTYGAYSTYAACTADVYYGDTHSCAIAATTEYKAASVASYTVTGANTKQMDVARQTYQQTIQIRYQNASGGWGSYDDYSSCTKDVYYGANHSCSYGGDTTYAAASISTYQVTGDNTKYMDVYRNTRTVTLSKGTGVSSVVVTGTGVKSDANTASATVYYGGAVTITATMSSGYDWVNWTGSATYSDRAQSISSVTSNLSFTANGKARIYMQDVTTSSCPTSRTLVYDRRDEKSYYIQKIGSVCWMTTNLDLAGGTTLTPSTSNVTRNYKLPTSSISGFNNAGVPYVYNSGSTTCGTTSACYSYYSWLAATAGLGTTSVTSGNVSEDICPKGWRLPTQSNAATLANSYNSYTKLMSAPFYGVAAGTVFNGSFYGNSEAGVYWTSTAANDDSYVYTLFHGPNSVPTVAADVNPRRFGYSVRCVAK